MQIPIHYIQTLFCVNNPDSTDHCGTPEITGIKMSNRSTSTKWCSDPKCQHPGTHGQTLFLIIKEQQGQTLQHEWEEQGLRIKDTVPQGLNEECRSELITRSLKSPVTIQSVHSDEADPQPTWKVISVVQSQQKGYKSPATKEEEI